jgi:hypothetical protein
LTCPRGHEQGQKTGQYGGNYTEGECGKTGHSGGGSRRNINTNATISSSHMIPGDSPGGR